MRKHVLAWMAAGIGLAVAVASPALAQRDYGDDRYGSGFKSRESREPERQKNVAGDFDYYTLVMSWSPTYCSEKDSDEYDPQCDRQDGRRYAFVLHGLWPQYERGYPEHCWTPRKPFVPQTIIDTMLDIMPSPKLVIHEYKKHGTCSGLDPTVYYQISRKLFRSIRIPERYVNPNDAMFVSPGELEEELIEENPGLSADMLSISCGGAGNRLREVRICFSRDGNPAACGSNEEQRRLCNAQKMYVPPVRSSKFWPDTVEDREKAKRDETPRPRTIPSVGGSR